MASVHLARADGPGGFQKWVAIKRIHRHLAEDETFVRMFLDEARVAARISHPNVAQVFELGRQGAGYWLAMEYLHGESLREVMRARAGCSPPGLDPYLAACLAADAAEGLHAAHELRDRRGSLLGLVHRDVSPQNIFVTYDGAVKVVDFGIAAGSGRLAVTRAGTLKGKIAYMSPEQARGYRVDRRTDVFALGVVLWELLTGRRLFRGSSEVATLERVHACRVPPPSEYLAGFPADLEQVLLRALERDASRRFSTARDLSFALRRVLVDAGACIGYDEIAIQMRTLLAEQQRARQELLEAAELRMVRSSGEARPPAVPTDTVQLVRRCSAPPRQYEAPECDQDAVTRISLTTQQWQLAQKRAARRRRLSETAGLRARAEGRKRAGEALRDAGPAPSRGPGWRRPTRWLVLATTAVAALAFAIVAV